MNEQRRTMKAFQNAEIKDFAFTLAFKPSLLSECDKSVFKLSPSSFYGTKKEKGEKGSFAHLVAEQHDDHILLGIIVYFSQPGL